jgi:DNA invertase Pin-like site-specific DNA recombinase
MSNWQPKYVELKIKASKMRDLFNAGKTVQEIADIYHSSIDSVYKYLHYMGVKLPKPAHDEKSGRFVGSNKVG